MHVTSAATPRALVPVSTGETLQPVLVQGRVDLQAGDPGQVREYLLVTDVSGGQKSNAGLVKFAAAPQTILRRRHRPPHHTDATHRQRPFATKATTAPDKDAVAPFPTERTWCGPTPRQNLGEENAFGHDSGCVFLDFPRILGLSRQLLSWGILSVFSWHTASP
ncbi:unnamed protein product [Lampetra fluviatilis]